MHCHRQGHYPLTTRLLTQFVFICSIPFLLATTQLASQSRTANFPSGRWLPPSVSFDNSLSVPVSVASSHRTPSKISSRKQGRQTTGTVLPKKDDPNWTRLLPPKAALAGGASRAVAQAVLYPVDALRTLAQTRDGRTLADVGTRALVRGCGTTSSFALLQGAIQFGIFNVVQDRAPWAVLRSPVVASALGAAGSCVVSVPQEVIKQRLVTGVYTSFRQATSSIYQTEGIRGFYSAWRPTVTRNVPFVITTFTAMDAMKKRIIKKRQGNSKGPVNLTTLENFVVGIGSALVGGIVTQPVDVVKTRMMTQAASTAQPYTSALDCLVTMARQEGPLALYSGFPQRAVYMGGLWGIIFALNGYFMSNCQEIVK